MRWHPDTCECIVQADRDPVTLALGPWRPVSKCSAHADVPDGEIHAVVLAENQRKNELHRSVTSIDDAAPDLGLWEVIDEPPADIGHRVLKRAEMLEYRAARQTHAARKANGRLPRRLKKDAVLGYEWEGSGKNRKLVAYLEAGGTVLTKKQKDDLKAHCDTKFGPGKVAIVHE